MSNFGRRPPKEHFCKVLSTLTQPFGRRCRLKKKEAVKMVDCNFICNPDNNMPGSCANLCTGFNYTTSTPMTTSNAPKEGGHHLAFLITTVCTAVLSFVVLCVLICCCKDKIKKLFHTITFKYLKFSIEETRREGYVGRQSSNITTQEHVVAIAEDTDENSLLQQAPGESVNCDSAGAKEIREERKALIDNLQSRDSRGNFSLVENSSSGFFTMNEVEPRESVKRSATEEEENTYPKTVY